MRLTYYMYIQMAYLYLIRESNLPEVVVNLICEFTGTREQWTKKNMRYVLNDVKYVGHLEGKIKNRIEDLSLIEIRIFQMTHFEYYCNVLKVIKNDDDDGEYYSTTKNELYYALTKKTE